MLETEQRLAEKVAKVCRDYNSMTWDTALNSAGVPTDSELRKAEKVFYPKHIREIPTNPSLAALPSFAFKQVPSAQDLPIDVGTFAGVDTGKEGLPPASDASSEDTLTIRASSDGASLACNIF